MIEQTCSRCDSLLERPHDKNANYILASDFIEEERREVHYAMVHTEETRRKVDDLSAHFPNRDWQQLAGEMASPEADDDVKLVVGTEVVEDENGGRTETIQTRDETFSIPESEFRHFRIDDPNAVQHDDDVAHTYTIIEPCECQKSALVCRDCLKNDDEIIWGADK